MSYNCGPGYNPLTPNGGQFVELSPIQCLTELYPAHLDWGYQPPHQEFNPVGNWHDNPPVTRESLMFPKPEPVFRPFTPESHRDPDPWYTPAGVIRSKPVHTWEREDPELSHLGKSELFIPKHVREQLLVEKFVRENPLFLK